MKNRTELGNGVYLCPIHRIMNDGCLRFLVEEMEEHGIRERKERKGNKEEEKKILK